ncbi:MAG: DedA family protein [Bdellovibrionales bacterium]|nr:DedA family protein [Bdellovibrionales bacterium]
MLHSALHGWLVTWFAWVEHWGYAGVFFLMAMESSIFPVPSEIVMAPAAFWAAQGKMDFWGVVVVGTLGSYFGSLATYLVSRSLGLPMIHHLSKRYGKLLFLSGEKLRQGEAWVERHGIVGIFVARLLPVIRHLIGIPAGVFRMPLGPFSAATLVGAGLWCFVLSWFGREVIGNSPELLQSPEQLIAVMKAKVIWIVAGVAVFGALYGIMAWMRKSPVS